MKRRVRNEKGMILVLALLLLLVLTLVGISSISSTSFEAIIAGNDRLANAAFYASEAGVQVGLNQIPDTTPVPKTKIEGDTYYSGTVAYVGFAQSIANDQRWAFKRYEVTAMGEAQLASKEIDVQTRYGPFPSGTDYNY